MLHAGHGYDFASSQRAMREFGREGFDQTTTVTTIAGKEQRFVRCKPQGRRTRKQVRRKLALQF